MRPPLPHLCRVPEPTRKEIRTACLLSRRFHPNRNTERTSTSSHLWALPVKYQWTSFSTEKIINIFLTHCVNKTEDGMYPCSVIKYTSLLFLLIKKDFNASIFLIYSSFGGSLWCMDPRVNCALGGWLCSSWLGTKNKDKGFWDPKLGLVTISRQPRWSEH